MSPTLALLNIRLGYWLRNPRSLASSRPVSSLLKWLLSRITAKFYLALEMLNMLDEKRRNIYLTDGGHIENLGVHELLERGCQLIIAVDAECDPTMSLSSLLERYARIRTDQTHDGACIARRRTRRPNTAKIKGHIAPLGEFFTRMVLKALCCTSSHPYHGMSETTCTTGDKALGFHAAFGFLSASVDLAFSADTWTTQETARAAIRSLVPSFVMAV